MTPVWAQSAIDITPRGYTGHEHVDEMGIIHMNGRIYDALLGRFLQADPFVRIRPRSIGIRMCTTIRRR